MFVSSTRVRLCPLGHEFYPAALYFSLPLLTSRKHLSQESMRSQALSAPAKSSLDEAMTDVQSAIPAMASASAAALSSLSDLLDAFDTLPCIKYVAGVAVKILRTIDVRIFVHKSLIRLTALPRKSKRRNANCSS